MLTIHEFPTQERPRERLVKHGAQALSDAELLAVILRTGNKAENVLTLSRRLMRTHPLNKMRRAGVATLLSIKGIGPAKACQIVACFELARRVQSEQQQGKCITAAQDIVQLLGPQLSGLKQEHSVGVYLDARQRVLKLQTLFIGTLDMNVIHPREVFKTALLESAAGIIFVHNHPSGDPEPSEEDIAVTQQLRRVGEIMNIDLVDHVILGEQKYVSLRERGYL